MHDQRQSELQGEPKRDLDQVRPESIGGWLLYFCIVSIFIGPLVSLNAILKPANLYWLACSISLIILSVSAGIAIWMRAEPAFNLVRLDLIARTLYGVAKMGSVLHLRSLNQPLMVIASEAGRVIGTFLSGIIWFSYFKISSRVKRTFGRNI